MRLKTRVFLSLFLTFIVSSGVIFFAQSQNLKEIKSLVEKDIYEHRKVEIEFIIEQKGKFLLSMAKFLSTNKSVIEAYLNDDPEILKREVEPLWRSLKEMRFIYEIHFFKRPALSFVNFANPLSGGKDLEAFRKDIAMISKSFQPSKHFLICRSYPGYRVTYPIIYRDRLIGSVSVGIDLNVFRDFLKKLGAEDVILALNNKELKRYLLPKNYEKLSSKGKIKEEFLLISDMDHEVDLTDKVEFKSNRVYSKYLIKDIEGKKLGYIVVVDNLDTILKSIKKSVLYKTMLSIFMIYLLFFFLTLYILNLIFKKIEKIKKISDLLKEKKFHMLPQKSEAKSKIDELKNNIIDTACELEKHINLLTKEIENYKDKAYIDALTGAFNRHFLEEYGKLLFEKSRLTHTSFTVLLIDIDNFKKINDTHGHDFGDYVLGELVKRIKSVIREKDMIIRMGGEEIAVILQETGLENGYRIAKKILEEIKNRPFVLGSKSAIVTVSIGLSEPNDSDKNIYDTIKRADEKLYIAKKQGKNRIEI